MDNGYKDLIVWQKSIDLVAETYQIIKLLPREENFALCDQMRRAVISVPSNIAEGSGRKTSKDFIHFLSIARGSAYELETQLILARKLGYVTNDQINHALGSITEICRIINGLMEKLEKK